jgi:hypothetical protein
MRVAGRKRSTTAMKDRGFLLCVPTHTTDSSLWLSFNYYLHKRKTLAYFTESPDTVVDVETPLLC